MHFRLSTTITYLRAITRYMSRRIFHIARYPRWVLDERSSLLNENHKLLYSSHKFLHHSTYKPWCSSSQCHQEHTHHAWRDLACQTVPLAKIDCVRKFKSSVNSLTHFRQPDNVRLSPTVLPSVYIVHCSQPCQYQFIWAPWQKVLLQ